MQNASPNKVVTGTKIAAQFCVRYAYNTKPVRNLVRLQRRQISP